MSSNFNTLQSTKHNVGNEERIGISSPTANGNNERVIKFWAEVQPDEQKSVVLKYLIVDTNGQLRTEEINIPRLDGDIHSLDSTKVDIEAFRIDLGLKHLVNEQIFTITAEQLTAISTKFTSILEVTDDNTGKHRYFARTSYEPTNGIITFLEVNKGSSTYPNISEIEISVGTSTCVYKETALADIDSFKYNFRQIVDMKNHYVANSGAQLTEDGNGIKVLLQGELWHNFYSNTNLIPSHKYYVSPNSNNKFIIYLTGNFYGGGPFVSNNATIITANGVNISFSLNNNFENTDTVAYPILIDLTEMFGAGNEPNTVEEVQQYLVPNKYYPYGKNIEPSMYVAKGEVNKKMLGLPDWSNTLEIARNVQYNKWTNNTGKNGYYNVVLSGTSNNVDSVKFQIKINDNIYSGVSISGVLSSNNREWSCTIPIGINDNIEFYKNSGTNISAVKSIFKFVYAKEV